MLDDEYQKMRYFSYFVFSVSLTVVKQLQVHRAVAKDGTQVAMKVQYPGVADSIESDIENVRLLLDYANLIPGLHLDRAMKVSTLKMCHTWYQCLDYFSPSIEQSSTPQLSACNLQDTPAA